MSIYEKTLKPLMDKFALSYELFVTKHVKEAEDYLHSVENLLAKYSAIVLKMYIWTLFQQVKSSKLHVIIYQKSSSGHYFLDW